VKLIKEFWSYRDLLRLLVVKDIKLKYRRSILGYVWSILNPLLIMSVMAVVFSAMFKRNIENFPVYLFCGQLLFNFMNSSTHVAIFSITANAPLLKKTYVPKYIFTVAKITSGMVDLVFSLGALLIVMLVTGARFSWTNLLFPLVILQLYVFCVGMSLFLSQANVFFRDIQYIYNAVTTAWMYLTPIFYPVEMLPDWLRGIVTHFNPMYFYVTQFRDIVYHGRLPSFDLLLAGTATALGMLAVGFWCFRKSEDKFILYI
jgi:lipopolysaccharide transport system permease protein